MFSLCILCALCGIFLSFLAALREIFFFRHGTIQPMTLNFTKMHGLGNDFIVIDAINQAVSLSAEQVRALADRRFGIGCDQLLLVEQASSSAADFRYRIYNADGGEVGQCGNGARCFMQFVHEQGLSSKDEMQVETSSGPLHLSYNPNGHITVNMGIPRLEPAEIPFDAAARNTHYPLTAGTTDIKIAAVSMGNPHAIMQVDDCASAPVATLGPLIEQHPRFPQRVNAGFVEIVDVGNIRLRVYERGAGETLACGSGACAAVVAGQLWGQLDDTVKVMLNGGELVVSWAGEAHPVLMTGPATSVYRGQIDL